LICVLGERRQAGREGGREGDRDREMERKKVEGREET
jgi:hypothetical protein